MKQAGIQPWTDENDVALNRCLKTKKLIVVGEAVTKGARTNKYIVLSYLSSEWYIQIISGKKLETICKTGQRGGGKVSNPSVADVINLIKGNDDINNAKTKIFYNSPVGLKIVD